MKLMKLTYNEILKQVKKKGFIISLCILILFSIGLPVLYKLFAYSNTTYPIFNDSSKEYYENQIIKNPSTNDDKLFNELLNEKLSIIDCAINKKEQSTSFKNTLYDEYTSVKLSIIVLDKLINNEKINTKNIDEWFMLNTTDYINYTKEELIKQKQVLEKQALELKNTIDKNDYTWYLKRQIQMMSNDSENDKKIINLLKELINLNITDENDFRAKEANKIIDYYNQKEHVLTEQEYNKQNNKKLSYETYVKITKEKNKEIDNNILKSYYAIRNNYEYSNNAKTTLNEIIDNNITVISIIIVVIAGGIVANEFQKGTIRLLVIRPSKRWKLLLSKFLAVISLTIIFGLITYIMSFITCSISFGFRELLTNDLSVIGTQVVKTSYIASSISSLFIQLIPIIFIALGAFFLSTITNSTALSVGLSIFVLMGSSLAMMILLMLKFPFLDLTFLPYLSFNQFVPINKITLLDNYMMYQIYYTLPKALLVLGIWGIILYTISNVVFTKKDIKN